jgi:hypothetical protein
VQHNLDAGAQQAQIKRLGYVLIGTEFKSDDLIDRVARGG